MFLPPPRPVTCLGAFCLLFGFFLLSLSGDGKNNFVRMEKQPWRPRRGLRAWRWRWLLAPSCDQKKKKNAERVWGAEGRRGGCETPRKGRELYSDCSKPRRLFPFGALGRLCPL